MSYALRFAESCRQDLLTVSKAMKERFYAAAAKVAEDPYRFKRLVRTSNFFRVRVGNFRLIYKVENEVILFVRFGNRENVYRKF